MPQLAWFMVAFSGIAFVFGAARAAAEFGQIGLIRFFGLAAGEVVWTHYCAAPVP